MGDTALIATREVRERIRDKVFRVGTVLMLVAVAAAIVIPTLHRSTSRAQRAGVVGGLAEPLATAIVGTGASFRIPVDLVTEASAQAAADDLRAGRVGLVILDARTLEVAKAISASGTSTRAQFVRAVARTLSVDEAFAAAGLSSSQAAQLAGAKPLPVTSLERPSRRTTRAASLVGLILVFVMLTQYSAWTLTGVMEEKSSRVVEVLLAAVRPTQLLTGKVLGIGLVALTPAALVVATALATANAVGSDILHGTTPQVLASTVVWFVLGYAFYCWVYAAAGAMAERQDQAQSLALPLSLPIVFGYVVALTAVGPGNPTTLLRVLAYLPPTAPFAVPALVSLGAMSWWEFSASVMLSIVRNNRRRAPRHQRLPARDPAHGTAAAPP